MITVILSYRKRSNNVFTCTFVFGSALRGLGLCSWTALSVATPAQRELTAPWTPLQQYWLGWACRQNRQEPGKLCVQECWRRGKDGCSNDSAGNIHFIKHLRGILWAVSSSNRSAGVHYEFTMVSWRGSWLLGEWSCSQRPRRRAYPVESGFTIEFC